MTKNSIRYEINDKDIEAILHYLQTNMNKEATVEDAVNFLEEKQALTHLAAHKIVEDEMSGKIKISDDKVNK